MTNVVRYKPTSRCTTVVPITYEEGTTGPSPVVLKTHVGDKGSTAWDAMRELWDRPETWRDTVLLAEPLAFEPEEKILVQGPIPEAMTLKELARNAIREGDPAMLDSLREELAKTGRALAAIHASGATYKRVATFDDELVEVQDVIDRLSLTVPSLKGAGAQLIEQLAEAGRQAPADAVRPRAPRLPSRPRCSCTRATSASSTSTARPWPSRPSTSDGSAPSSATSASAR